MALTSTPPRTAADHAFVTLITSDSYLPGALAQSAALNDLHPTRRGGPFPASIDLEKESDPVPFTTVCLVTPETVSVGTIKELRRTFDLVLGVEVIEGDKNAEEIKLLGRPDLHQTFTKLHILRLAQFASIVFLDADVLPLRPMSHLLNMVSSWPDAYFQDDGGDKTPTGTALGDTSGSISFLTASTITTRNPHRLNSPAFPCPVSAAPDSGWPDIFNSGVIVLAPPGERGFKEAMGLRSWDGGDQGTLNEWVGSQGGQAVGQGSGGPGWNRLSFKYNVTPTAAYTYAPAYAKFGSGIHAVHFIGGSKPWSSLSFRPAFISSSGRQVDKYDISAYGLAAQNTTPESRESAYAYHTLVDRWYAVYDAHFRVAMGADGAPKSEFEVRKYESAWEGGKSGPEFTAYDGGADSGLAAPDQQNQFPHVIPPHTYHVSLYSTSTGQPAAAVQPASLEELRNLALHGIGRADVARAGEGAYISLPLEGRFSLMRPPPPEQAPAPVEVHHYEEPAPTHFHQPAHEHEHHRPSSPPMVAWNPAFEPPPTTAPVYANNLPSNAWYENQWDMPHTRNYHHGHDDSQAPEAFFQPPQSGHYIPKELIDGGEYSSFAVNGFQPDQTQIKSVFPWEEETDRPAPTRAFPDFRQPPPPKPQEPPKESPPLPRSTSPPRPFGATYYNAWDDIPSIQRYAARLTGAKLPPSSEAAKPAAAPAQPPQKEWSWEREQGDSGDASSRDGDDEDDEEEPEVDGEGTPKAGGTNGVGNNGTSRPKLKSRTSSRSGSRTDVTAGNGHDAPLEAPVQTLGSTQPGQIPNSQLKGFELYLSERRNAQGALEGPQGIPKRLAMRSSGTPAFIRAPGNERLLPTLVRTSGSDRLTIAGDDGTSPPSMAEPSFESSRLSRRALSTAIPSSVAATLGSILDIPSHTRNISSESEFANDSSPTSSTGSSSPYELEPSGILPPARTFDDARSVDAFKRDSHEVLARFLKMGTWGGGSSQDA